MFYMPVKVYMGRDCVKRNAHEFARLGKRALIVTGRSSGQRSGALGDCIDVLKSQNISYSVFDKVENNPTLENTVLGGKAAKDVDFIIGIGGGSPLDASKAIAVFARNDIEPMRIFDGKYPNKPLPIIAIPTTAGTGSEVTPYSILTLDEIKNKKSFTSEDVFPKVAFLDAKYTETLPTQTAIDTMVDAMSHCVESILNKNSSYSSEYIALEGLRIIGKYMAQIRNPSYEARERFLFASMLGGMAIAQTGSGIVHSMGYQLTYFKNIPHGRANGLLMGEYLIWMEKAVTDKVALILETLGLESSAAFKKLLSGLLPFDESVTMDEIKSFVKTSIKAKNVSNALCRVTEDDEIGIYARSLLT